MDFTQIVIVIVFFLLNKGHEAEILQKEYLFYYGSHLAILTSVAQLK